MRCRFASSISASVNLRLGGLSMLVAIAFVWQPRCCCESWQSSGDVKDEDGNVVSGEEAFEKRCCGLKESVSGR